MATASTAPPINAKSRHDAAPVHKQLRFVNNQGQPPSKRRRISAACLTCRRRKTRCAGERPLCSTCTKNGHECLGYREDDRRDGDDDADNNHPEDEEVSANKYDKEVNEQTGKSVLHHDAQPPAVQSSMTDTPVQTPTFAVTQPALEEHDDLTPSDQNRQQPNATPGLRSSHPLSPTLRRGVNSNRVPYFRLFGPTAIVPGFKRMVVSIRDRHYSNGSQAGASPRSNPGPHLRGTSAAGSDACGDDLPVYDINDPTPAHPLILSLVKTFFAHLGCNYPFLKERTFLKMVRDKTAEPILVDAVCALSARFSDLPAMTGGNSKTPRTDRGVVFAQRAKAATVDTFPAPSVGAVQACLLMAYEGFGANQDSALWMYLGLAIRMAIDLGLQKRIGIQFHGEEDPCYNRQRSRNDCETSPEVKKTDDDSLTLEEQREIEQERTDTFWAVFFLDRVISSGTGRPVTFREEDFEIAFPEPHVDLATGWPAPFPILVEIIHLYGRASDVLNKIRDIDDLTQEKWDKIRKMEQQLTRAYKTWDPRLHFNADNFKAYLSLSQGTTFILLHFWFHAMFITLHQPTLMTPFGDLRSESQLLSDSRELSMSSAKTICDILAFADLIDPGSFVGNPFTSQPIYIAACAFLRESKDSSVNPSAAPSAVPSTAPSREGSVPATAPPVKKTRLGGAGSIKDGSAGVKGGNGSSKRSRHSMLTSAANQNYQRCYNSLQHLHTYWGGIKYILTALDQKSEGIWDVETFTAEEYESTKIYAQEAMAAHTSARRTAGSVTPQFLPPPSWETAANAIGSPRAVAGNAGPPIAWSLAGTADSPNSSLTLMYQNLPGIGTPMDHYARPSRDGDIGATPPGNMVYDPIRHVTIGEGMFPPPAPSTVPVTTMGPGGLHLQPRRLASFEGAIMPNATDNNEGGYVNAFTPGSNSNGFTPYDVSSGNTVMPEGHAAHQIHLGQPGSGMYDQQNAYPPPGAWGGLAGMDAITFDSQDIDIGLLGLQAPDLMAGWLDFVPGDLHGLYGDQHMGQPQ